MKLRLSSRVYLRLGLGVVSLCGWAPSAAAEMVNFPSTTGLEVTTGMLDSSGPLTLSQLDAVVSHASVSLLPSGVDSASALSGNWVGNDSFQQVLGVTSINQNTAANANVQSSVSINATVGSVTVSFGQ